MATSEDSSTTMDIRPPWNEENDRPTAGEPLLSSPGQMPAWLGTETSPRKPLDDRCKHGRAQLFAAHSAPGRLPYSDRRDRYGGLVRAGERTTAPPGLRQVMPPRQGT
jgi:hypothetical protein